MHPNGVLLAKLFTALNDHDHDMMASCYSSDARFRDIAFHRKGREEIHAMWRMICHGDIKATFEVLDADERDGHVHVVDHYTYGRSERPPFAGRHVRNEIHSRFLFRDGAIWRHEDDCDPKQWAHSALGYGLAGFLAGRSRLLRSYKAKGKLRRFVRTAGGSA
ncbi:MAG: nuclear transport factor 2 family protein [Alphaproteobacteria bacterium]|nr:nuclear transport factor 2 family protein [Alphaproteobacteria bacterium]MBV9371288.1 nuclear transport factor 2 family protein [Alphaproteobacteria bacterium]MBV9901752.1 nuclear transport factor 2 family protein [Alphaproteobacteria bacterium]